MKNKIWIIGLIILITISVIYVFNLSHSFRKIVDSDDTASMSFDMNPLDSLILSDSLNQAIIQKAVYYNKTYTVSQYVLSNEDELILSKYSDGQADFLKSYRISKGGIFEEKVGTVYSRYDFFYGSLIKELGVDNKPNKGILLSDLTGYNEIKRTKDTLLFECSTSGFNLANSASERYFKFGFQVMSKRLYKTQFLLMSRKQGTYLFIYLQNKKSAASLLHFLRKQDPV